MGSIWGRKARDLTSCTGGRFVARSASSIPRPWFPKGHECLFGWCAVRRNFLKYEAARGRRRGNVQGRLPLAAPAASRGASCLAGTVPRQVDGRSIQVAMGGPQTSGDSLTCLLLLKPIQPPSSVAPKCRWIRSRGHRSRGNAWQLRANPCAFESLRTSPKQREVEGRCPRLCASRMEEASKRGHAIAGEA